jgi:hypothetical protein
LKPLVLGTTTDTREDGGDFGSTKVRGVLATESARTLSFSVIIAWVNPIELILPVIEGFLGQTAGAPDEILVATRHPQALRECLQAQFPEVRILAAPATATIPALRSMAIKAASCEAVMVTEDHCVPAKNWMEVADRVLSEGNDIVGGPVENACTSRMRDWAAFLTEYAVFLRAEGIENPLPGNNIAYRRKWATDICAALDRGLWESFCYDDLKKKGAKVAFEKDLMVYHRRPFNFGYFAHQRVVFCRSYAAMRLPAFGPIHRIVYGFGSLVLPPMLMWRTWGQLSLRRRFRGKFLACLPLIAVYFAAGAVGEMFGYFFGGGESLSEVE